MIIYNSKEIKPTYRTGKDNRIIEIRSIYNINDLLTKLRNNEELKDEVNIKVYKTDNIPENREYLNFNGVSSTDLGYDFVFSSRGLDEDVYIQKGTEIRAKRPILFQAYEGFVFNNEWKDIPFTEDKITKEELMDELYDAIGIMPTLKDISDKTVSELIEMSETGERLYRNYIPVNEKNKLPKKEDIELYKSLSVYEQRLINESKAHPMKLLDTIRGIKERNNKAYLTKDDVSNIENRETVKRTIEKAITPFMLRSTPENREGYKSDQYILLQILKILDNSSPSEQILTDYFNALKSLSLPDYENIIEEYKNYFPDIETMLSFIKALSEERVIDNETLNKVLLNDSLSSYLNFAVKEWQKFINKHPSYEDKDFVEFSKKEYKIPGLEKIENAFKDSFGGHAPRILPEYVYAYCLINKVNSDNRTLSYSSFSELTNEDIEKMVSGFKLKNVQKIASSKNINLLAFSPYINYAELKQEYIDILATEIKNDKLNELYKNGFTDWLKTHKNINISELSNLLKIAQETRNFKFDSEKSAKELIESVTMKEAVEAKNNYERKYHYNFSDNELAIRGREIVATDGKLKMYMLKPDDLRNFTIGDDTNCCQAWGNSGSGENCVWKYTTDPFAGAVVIERNGKILAQSFVWTDEINDTFVFDNIEFANDAQIGTYENIILGYIKSLPYSNVHIGTGYLAGNMNSWGKKITYGANMPKTLFSSCPHHSSMNCNENTGWVYSDYHFKVGEGRDVARSIKTNGRMERNGKLPVKVEIIPDKPTRWDILMHPGVNFLLNDFNTPIEKRIEFADKFLHNQTPEIQNEAVRKNPAAIKYIENPTEEVQKYVVNLDKENARYIKNPCSEVQRILLHDDVHYINNIENPSEDMMKYAVSTDGLLLEKIKNPSDAVIDLAIKQNGYAIRMIPSDRQTEERQIEAVNQNPKIVSLLTEPTDNVVKTAIDKNPRIVGLLPNLYNHLQVYAVNKDPSVINDIKNPTLPAIEAAVKKNGMLIRNFQRRVPNLRMDAIKQNGFVIRVLKDPTIEEMVTAVKTTPASINAIKDKNIRNEIRETIRREFEEQKEECEFQR